MASQPPIEAEFGATEAEAKPAFPWPPAEGESLIDAAGRTWRESAMRPATFFRSMPRGHGIGSALMYYLPLGILVEGINLFWRFTLGPARFDAAPGNEFLEALAGTNPLMDFLISPVYLLLALFVSVAASHAVLAIAGGARHGFRTSVRVFSFAYSPALLAVIPRAGFVIGCVWMVVLAIIGLREAHETSGFKAAAAVLLPLLIMGAILFVFVLLMLAGSLAVLR